MLCIFALSPSARPAPLPLAQRAASTTSRSCARSTRRSPSGWSSGRFSCCSASTCCCCSSSRCPRASCSSACARTAATSSCSRASRSCSSSRPTSCSRSRPRSRPPSAGCATSRRTTTRPCACARTRDEGVAAALPLGARSSSPPCSRVRPLFLPPSRGAARRFVLGFMLANCWLVPFAFFITLSVNESVLPSQQALGAQQSLSNVRARASRITEGAPRGSDVSDAPLPRFRNAAPRRAAVCSERQGARGHPLGLLLPAGQEGRADARTDQARLSRRPAAARGDRPSSAHAQCAYVRTCAGRRARCGGDFRGGFVM